MKKTLFFLCLFVSSAVLSMEGDSVPLVKDHKNDDSIGFLFSKDKSLNDSMKLLCQEFEKNTLNIAQRSLWYFVDKLIEEITKDQEVKNLDKEMFIKLVEHYIKHKINLKDAFIYRVGSDLLYGDDRYPYPPSFPWESILLRIHFFKLKDLNNKFTCNSIFVRVHRDLEMILWKDLSDDKTELYHFDSRTAYRYCIFLPASIKNDEDAKKQAIKQHNSLIDSFKYEYSDDGKEIN